MFEIYFQHDFCRNFYRENDLISSFIIISGHHPISSTIFFHILDENKRLPVFDQLFIFLFFFF